MRSELRDTKTHAHLREAFARDSQANRRFLYFAQKADVEGFPDIANLFRTIADAETGHTFGHLDQLAAAGDPITGGDIGVTEDNLRAAIDAKSDDAAERYPSFAKVAREEGFDDIAEWFETVARAHKLHAGRLTEALDRIR